MKVAHVTNHSIQSQEALAKFSELYRRIRGECPEVTFVDDQMIVPATSQSKVDNIIKEVLN